MVFAALPMLARLLTWTTVAVGVALAAAIDFMPLLGAAKTWPVPDLLLCLVVCLSLRRPAWLPLALVFAAGLGRDLLTGGAVGAGAMVLLLIADRLSSRATAQRSAGWLGEWAAAAAAAVLMVAVPALLVWLVLADVPSAGALLDRWLATVAAYPVVALLVPLRRRRDAAGGVGVV